MRLYGSFISYQPNIGSQICDSLEVRNTLIMSMFRFLDIL